MYIKRNLAAVDEFIAPEQIDHSLPPGLPRTREGTRKAISMTLTAFPDLNLKVEDMIAEGDKVVTTYLTLPVHNPSSYHAAPVSRILPSEASIFKCPKKSDTSLVASSVTLSVGLGAMLSTAPF